MPCFWPTKAWKTRAGDIVFGKEVKDSEPRELPCGKCIGCQERIAQHWALRCTHEYVRHDSTLFVTLTYRDADLPPTLTPKHVSGFLKRLRAAKQYEAQKAKTKPKEFRFFASGEYGEQTHRPHYHALLFGASETDKEAIRKAWPYGDNLDIQVAGYDSIAYVAGYCNKKYDDPTCTQKERVDRRTGEVYTYQKPFRRMSRGGRYKKGIGAHARDNYTTSWHTSAILNGKTISVPRYYNDKWKTTATPTQIEKNENEKNELMKTIRMTEQQRRAAELIAKDRVGLKNSRRQKL